ncbi:MAG: EVE domain-containing protein [Bradyrhizobiaceae bacterium]|nr:EVE domain-containing protein [Bradyrhizobiaceae bacterium]
MAYWLLKSEPGTWSWDDQVKAGAKGTAWDGVRNHQAKQNLMQMKKGDRAFFYHSGEEKAVVGVVEITGEHRPDPSDKTGTFVVVDVKAVAPMPEPVTLKMCKAEKALAKMVLLNNSRLSVQPVTAAEWAIVCRLGGYKAG